MKRIANVFWKLNCRKRACAVFVLCATTATALSAQFQAFDTLVSFDGANGSMPDPGMVQATNGDLYGTTAAGGAYSFGTVFRMTPKGALTTLYSFCSLANCADGATPYAGLVQATNGDLYGTTLEGGAYATTPYSGYGTVFKITPNGTLTTLYSFCSLANCADGEYPQAGLVQATNGALYGTTWVGGAAGYGTVFKITPGGTLTTLYSFCSLASCADGESPSAGLVQARNGDLYGTTYGGPTSPFSYSYGTVFRITPSGTLTTLYSFCSLANCADGAMPFGGLLQAADGNLYGVTTYGGAGTTAAGYGSVFRMTPSGTLTTLYGFCSLPNCADGGYPGPLVQATNGDLYGTTAASGNLGYCNPGQCGAAFQLTLSGTLAILHSFCSPPACDDGGPAVALVQATNGRLYGTTQGRGAYNDGTVFSLSVGLGPFVESLPTAAKIGSAVKILGTDLTGATSVTFNGTAATFTVTSATLITTTVPAGATTGTIKVVTPGGTLSSNVPFRVLP